jgi:drug/metabolite transporter (DMT)-like permease
MLSTFGFHLGNAALLKNPEPVHPVSRFATSNDPLRGVLYMSLAVLFMFPCLNASVKYLSHDFNTPMLIWVRSAGHFLFMLLAFLPGRGIRLFMTANLKIQIFRSILLLGATVFYFIALGFIPLATAAMIGFTSPFIVTALAPLMLGEQVGWRRWAAVFTGFIGAMIVMRPGTSALHWAAFLVLGTASCYALYQVMTRKIAGRDDPATTITYTAIVGTAIISCIVPFYWQTPQHWWQIALFIGIGFFGGFGHYFVVKAFQYGQASVLAPLAYGQLVGATMFGYWIFGDLPDLWSWVGSAIIIGCGLYIGYRESRRKKPAA